MKNDETKIHTRDTTIPIADLLININRQIEE